MKPLRKWLRWPGCLDSLFARILLLQVGVAVLLVAMLMLVLFSDQANVFAKAALPAWTAALRPLQAQLQRGEVPTLPQGIDVLVPVDLAPGPPPDGARLVRPGWAAPRYAALREGLLAHGIAVERMAVSGEVGQPMTWLELTVPGRTPMWVGIHGALENPGLRTRGAIGLLLSALVFLAAATWLSRVVARPLQDLQRTVLHFADTGKRPPALPARGPAEVRQLAQQFHAFAAQREQQDASRQMMLAGISHDLRSPLGRIRLAAELLPDVPGVAARRDSIVRNVQLADALVGAFLDLARAEAEPLEQRVDLAALVQALLADSDHADVQPLHCAAGPLWLAPASSALLQRSLVNLLDNARRHGRPALELTLHRRQGMAVLTVRDHGPGIPAHQREILLRPFYRGTADRGQPGTGLGLAVVERCVHRHGGQLALLDAGPGLRVELRLPLEKTPSDAELPAHLTRGPLVVAPDGQPPPVM